MRYQIFFKLHGSIRQPVYWIDAKFGAVAGDRYLDFVRPIRRVVAWLGGIR